jgi:flagellar protein FlaJ
VIKIVSPIIQRLARLHPNLGLKLKQAAIKYTPEQFIQNTITIAFYMATGIAIFLFFLLARLGNVLPWIILGFPVLLVGFFFYFLKAPDLQISKKQKEISSEIVFAGRFIIIELESGVPLYDAFKNVAKNYESIGKYFSDIVTKIDLGTSMEAALNEAIEFTPSQEFRKILWQIINAQQTGADMATAMKSVVEQITKNQLIDIKEYGRKLNPLAMFYMIIAVILPSIGITMIIVLSTFLNLQLSLPILFVIAFFLGFMQFMFLAMIKSSRPPVEI